MTAFTFDKVPMNNLPTLPAADDDERTWIWNGYLAPGSIALLTSQWKSGKTTLVAGLLQALERDGRFLDRRVRAARALVVSEESREEWAWRLRTLPIGGHAQLLARPFATRPTFAEWSALLDDARALRARGELDLFVVDPLAAFLPGRCESDAASLLEALAPLRTLAAEGAAVLLLHHPRKKDAEPGSTARGSGALLGFVDTILELSRSGRLKSETCCRKLFALSRRAETPVRLDYEWDPASGRFATVADPTLAQYDANWPVLQRILAGRTSSATHHELLADWPGDAKPPSSALYEWLNRAVAAERVLRTGSGTRLNPYRYRLPRPEDRELAMLLEPLEPLPPLSEALGLRRAKR